jgi:CheY-like chemotaxis protein
MDHVSKSSCVLVVEDELLIAMDLEQMLQDLGFRESMLVSSCAEAERWLAAHKPIFAILDIRVRGGTCEAVAHHMVDHRIPFIVSSGIEANDDDPIFAKGVRIPKPCSPLHLTEALRTLVVHERALSISLGVA